ncbi:MAG: gfo/Idh/MocA family oxidoreductase, partial [Bacteroidia bacterium]
STTVELETESGKQKFDFTMPQHIQQPLIERVMDQLHDNGRCPSDGVSAARTNWVMEQVSKNK